MAGPEDTSSATGNLVRLTPGEWERRAAVAEEAAGLLLSASERVFVVSKNNYYGECVEGEAMYKTLMAALGKIRDSWTTQADAAQTVAESCSSASETLTKADLDSRSLLDS